MAAGAFEFRPFCFVLGGVHLGICLAREIVVMLSCQAAGMKGPYLRPPAPTLSAAEQLESARKQLEWNGRDLEGVTWAIHPGDLEVLRTVIGDATRLHGLWFTIAADPELAGAGPRLVWPEEWPDSWRN